MAQPSLTVTSATGEMVVDCVGVNHIDPVTMTLVQGAGQNLIGQHETAIPEHSGGASDENGAATVSMTWTGVATTNKWCQIGVSLKAAGAAASSRQSLMLMGMGR